MKTSKHEALHEAIWGGTRKANAPPAISIHKQKVLLILQAIKFVISTFLTNSWLEDRTKATAITLLLYVVTCFLYERRQDALYIRLVFFLTILGAFTDIGRPVYEYFGQSATTWLELFNFTISLLLSVMLLMVNINLLYRIAQQTSRLRVKRSRALKKYA